MDDRLREIRKKLNHLIENGANYPAILQVSMELDELIETYMEEHNKPEYENH